MAEEKFLFKKITPKITKAIRRRTLSLEQISRDMQGRNFRPNFLNQVERNFIKYNFVNTGRGYIKYLLPGVTTYLKQICFIFHNYNLCVLSQYNLDVTRP